MWQCGARLIASELECVPRKRIPERIKECDTYENWVGLRREGARMRYSASMMLYEMVLPVGAPELIELDCCGLHSDCNERVTKACLQL